MSKILINTTTLGLQRQPALAALRRRSAHFPNIRPRRIASRRRE